MVLPSGTEGLARFAGALAGTEASGGVCGLLIFAAFNDAAEFVLVNMARGALEGSAAVSLEMVPLGGL